MSTELLAPPQRKGRAVAAFTLVEALLAVATLAIVATGLGSLYMTGFQFLALQADDMLVQSQLRSEMERVVATPFMDLSNRTEVVTMAGRTYTSVWTVVLTDLDGDTNPEPDAKLATVEVAGRALTVIQVDHGGRLRKL